MDNDIKCVLWTETEISDRVSQIAAEILRDFELKSFESVVFVGVATGAFVFLADLVRKFKVSVAVDLVRVESYGFGTESNGNPMISSDLKSDVIGKHVILVEDIVETGNTLSCLISHIKSKGAISISVCAFLDKPAKRQVHLQLVGDGKFYRGFEVEDIVETGNTLSCLISHIKSKGAISISVCTFLDKPAKRQVHLQLVGDGKFYRGFECPESFVVGYGLDFAEQYRNLPYIGILKPEKYT